MEACVGAHHLSRHLVALRHDARLMPALYVKPLLKGQKNDFRDAEAIAEAVQRPRIRFVPTKSVEQLDLQALHRVRSRLVWHRTAVINQTRALLLERGIAVRQGHRFAPSPYDSGDGRRSQGISKAGNSLVRYSLIQAAWLRHQVDGDLNRQYEGTGLGLPLTKALVELHGGVLDLQSEVSVGTRSRCVFRPSGS